MKTTCGYKFPLRLVPRSRRAGVLVLSFCEMDLILLQPHMERVALQGPVLRGSLLADSSSSVSPSLYLLLSSSIMMISVEIQSPRVW